MDIQGRCFETSADIGALEVENSMETSAGPKFQPLVLLLHRVENICARKGF